MNSNFLPPGMDVWTVIGGFMGGVTSGLLKLTTPLEFVRKVIIGFVAGFCLTPMVWGSLSPALKLAGIDGQAGSCGAGFVVGLTGLLIIETIVQIVGKLGGVEIVARLLGGKTEGVGDDETPG